MTQAGSSHGLMAELEQRVEDYFDWLRDKTVLKRIPGTREYIEVTTPHLDRHNDCLQFYVRHDDGGLLLTDDGTIINDLELAGCRLDSPKRRQLLQVTLNGFGVTLEQNALTVRATPQSFPRKKHDLLQAMLAVDDMFALASPTVTSLFIEDVAAWLELNDVRSVRHIKLPGTSGYDHTFDFVIPRFKDLPERIVQTLNRPGKDSAEAMVFKWIDTREAREEGSEAFALLNDQEQTVPTGVIEALQSYDINAVLWSDRARVIGRLAA